MNRESFYLKTPLGRLKVDLRDGRLYSVSKPIVSDHQKGLKSADFFSARQNLKSRGREKNPLSAGPLRGAEDCALSAAAQKVKNQIEGYFLKKNRTFSVSLFDRGTPFQKAVWRELQKIPYGTTVTYRELAQKTGNPRRARAVGGACAKNPFLIVAPCHRVVAEGHLGGFALGLSAKRLLLKGERTAYG